MDQSYFFIYENDRWIFPNFVYFFGFLNSRLMNYGVISGNTFCSRRLCGRRGLRVKRVKRVKSKRVAEGLRIKPQFPNELVFYLNFHINSLPITGMLTIASTSKIQLNFQLEKKHFFIFRRLCTQKFQCKGKTIQFSSP
jgi:hypothetical protein